MQFAKFCVVLQSTQNLSAQVGKLPEWNASVRFKWKEGARFVSEICFLVGS